jgi:predicted amidophosphoribosyltransferase
MSASTTDPGLDLFTPAAAGTTGTVFTCALCQARFTHGDRVCGACPLHAGCDLVKCPNCGYQFPRSSRLVEWLERWRRRGREDR